jgi:hypothetical protein
MEFILRRVHLFFTLSAYLGVSPCNHARHIMETDVKTISNALTLFIIIALVVIWLHGKPKEPEFSVL